MTYKHKDTQMPSLIIFNFSQILHCFPCKAREHANNKTKPLRKPLEWEARVQGSILVLQTNLSHDLVEIYRSFIFLLYQ